ncbi:SDR family oxidoreductase [Symbioplanes lichenis]|uniref:SDR family oxidoreductase n=1 Tax=Symbioplanes lichenis TaxID=1629072 RepID=UPI0027385893|nr:SDR family oxidoreductase [Actinoplanes lichenis]
MFVITGATGQLGSRIVERLLARVPAEQVAVSVRDPEKAAGLAARGVRVRRGDFTDPGSLAHAFEGAEQVLVVSANLTGAEALAANSAAIDAAVAAGAERVVYTSHQGAARGSAFSPMHSHAASEAHLAATGRPWTSLRNGFYAETIRWQLGRSLESGELRTPADGPVSWTAHDDLAEAAAAVLTEPGRFEGPTPPLTAPQTVDMAGVAAMLGELTGRPIRHVVIGDEEFTAGLLANGVPEFRAAIALGMFQASRRGEFDVTAPDLEKLTGRPARSVRTLLEGVVSESR